MAVVQFFSILILLISQSMTAQHTYLALGDSYTIGELVEQDLSWPYQLTAKLNQDQVEFKMPDIIAVTGWRTDELLKAIEQENIKANTYDFVSLLIGVNNQYQGKPIRQYELEFNELLDQAILFSKHNTAGVFVVGIPDYSTTSFAQATNKPHIKSDLRAYNAYAQEVCQQKGIPFFDILELASTLNTKPGMLASDGLHPSGEQYKAWLDLFYKEVLTLIKQHRANE